MARGNERERRRAPKEAPRRGGKKRVCIFCKEHIEWVDYKDVNLLRRFMSDRGKIRARRVSGNCAQHQREVAVAIKTSRELALLPYTQRATAERGLGRGRRDGPVGPPPEARGVDAVEELPVVLEDAVEDGEIDVEAAVEPETDGGEPVPAAVEASDGAGSDES
jgi:small subunit ribosomal protein S18